MDFTNLVYGYIVVVSVFALMGVFIIVLGEHTEVVWFKYIGMLVFALSATALLMTGTIISTTMGYTRVGVAENSSEYGYVTITVPLEDRDSVVDKEYSLSELKQLYGSDYEGDKYILEEEAFIVEVDTTNDYEIIENNQD